MNDKELTARLHESGIDIFDARAICADGENVARWRVCIGTDVPTGDHWHAAVQRYDTGEILQVQDFDILDSAYIYMMRATCEYLGLT